MMDCTPSWKMMSPLLGESDLTPCYPSLLTSPNDPQFTSPPNTETNNNETEKEVLANEGIECSELTTLLDLDSYPPPTTQDAK